VQAVVVIPEHSVLEKYPEAQGALTREIAGVPLLIRVIATAARAGADSFLIIWPPDVDWLIWARCAASPLLQGLQVKHLVQHFNPVQRSSWAEITPALEEQFLWLPWNWVTHKRALMGLATQEARSVVWDGPALLEKEAVLSPSDPASSGARLRAIDGISITPRANVAEAERFLVAHSGKPTDGIYSKFNRMLCRPVVRLLTHTPVTPNQVTLGGLLVGMLGAYMFSQGFYAAYVGGALLFFLSGLFDEVDGMLARIKFRESVFGTWFEGLVDEATYLLLFWGITAGLYRERGPRELTYGFLVIVGAALSIGVTRLQRKLATAPGRPHEYAGRLNHLLESDKANVVSRIVRQIHIFIKKGVVVHYLLIFTVLGGLPLLLRLAALGANLTWTLALYYNCRFFRRGKAGARVGEAQAA
jgi:phosphatidylglycerophosphate synthase